MRERAATQRLWLLPSHPELAPQVLCYRQRTRRAFREVEPLREESFYTLEHQRSLLEQEQRCREEGKGLRVWMVPRGREGRIVGMAGLNEMIRGAFHSCFLSYQLEPEEQGKGYAAEAVGELLRIAFEELNLHRVEANIMPRNLPSRRLAQRVGMREEGLSREYLYINGRWEDHLHYVILNPSWRPEGPKRAVMAPARQGAAQGGEETENRSDGGVLYQDDNRRIDP